jgi:hypothetical protein
MSPNALAMPAVAQGTKKGGDPIRAAAEEKVSEQRRRTAYHRRPAGPGVLWTQ